MSSDGPGAGPSVGAPLVVGMAEEADRQAWDLFVSSRPLATAYHSWGWRTVIDRTFGHRAHYFVARRGGRIEGILPLVEVKGLLFGRTLTSLPFVNYGGVLADTAEAAFALLEAAVATAGTVGATHIELRHIGRQFAELPCKTHKVTMRMPLAPGLWERLDRKVRNQIRKAEKSDLRAERGGLALVPDFYTIFARNMRDLGTPVYTRRLFENVLDVFPDRAQIHVVRLKGQPIAAGVTFRSDGLIEVPWASSIRDFNNLCPNHLLYWHIMESAIADGCDTMDFGRSTPNEGTFKFKEQWGAEPVALHWEYWLPPGVAMPDQSPKNPKFRLAIEAWKRLPLPLANTVGPHIVRSIP